MTIEILNPSLAKEKPRAVVFDTDNTLYDYGPTHHKALSETQKKAMKILGISGREFDDTYNQARAEVKDRLGATASSHSRLLYFQRLIELLGFKTQLLLTLDLTQTYWRTFLTNARLFEGVKDFLNELRREDVQTAVITDLESQIQYRKIIYFGLENNFDYIVTSEEAGADKPGPAGFGLLRSKLKLSGERIWMVGDDPIADIKGGKECLGAVTFQKRHRGVEVDVVNAAPDVVFDSFRDLQELFRKREPLV